MYTFLLVLLILDALLLSVVVLLQAGQGGGLATMGGAGTESVLGGRQAVDHSDQAVLVVRRDLPGAVTPAVRHASGRGRQRPAAAAAPVGATDERGAEWSVTAAGPDPGTGNGSTRRGGPCRYGAGPRDDGSGRSGARVEVMTSSTEPRA